MRVLFVHRGASFASARVRVQNLVPYLDALGVQCETALFPSNASRLRALLAGATADVVVLQKKTPTGLDGWAWRASPAPIVFDYDDAILFRQTPRRESFESPTRRRRFARALRLADGFVCGNEYLASFCRPAAKPVLVAPSAVPLDVPQASPFRDSRDSRGDTRPGSRPARIGWIGAPHNLDELAMLAPALRDLASRHDFVLVVISEASIEIEGVRVEHVPWTLASQEAELARLDIGVMPLVDSPWTRGKCAYKLLQYMAAGVPAVASPVGMNREVVTHAENGLLAESPHGFGVALHELLSDPGLARRLGEAGRRSVLGRFCAAGCAEAWKAFLDDLVTG